MLKIVKRVGMLDGPILRGMTLLEHVIRLFRDRRKVMEKRQCQQNRKHNEKP